MKMEVPHYSTIRGWEQIWMIAGEKYPWPDLCVFPGLHKLTCLLVPQLLWEACCCLTYSTTSFLCHPPPHSVRADLYHPLLYPLRQELLQVQAPSPAQDSGFSYYSVSRWSVMLWDIESGFLKDCPKKSSGKTQKCRWQWEGANRLLFLPPSGRVFLSAIILYNLSQPHDQATSHVFSLSHDSLLMTHFVFAFSFPDSCSLYPHYRHP